MLLCLYIYIYIYVCIYVCMYVCMYVCVCVCGLTAVFHVSMFNFIKILSSVLISVLVSDWNWWLDLPKLFQ